MCFLCLLFTSPYFIPLGYVKMGFQILCISFVPSNIALTEFIKTWRLLFVYGGGVPISLIIFINILLVWKVVVYKNNLKTLVESVNLKSRKELKATIVVLILSVLFLIGNIMNFSVDLTVFFYRDYLSMIHQ